jgi:hypothetical protein
MRIIDPVEWYMRKHDEENVRPAYRRRRGAAAGWTRYASIDEGASDPELHRRLTEEASRREDAYRQAREVLRRDYTSFFEAKARELLDRHEVTIRGANGKVQARLVRFRNGMVFEHTETSPGSTGGGMTRIERTQLPQASRILAVYLENAVLGLGVAPGPLE